MTRRSVPSRPTRCAVCGVSISGGGYRRYTAAVCSPACFTRDALDRTPVPRSLSTQYRYSVEFIRLACQYWFMVSQGKLPPVDDSLLPAPNLPSQAGYGPRSPDAVADYRGDILNALDALADAKQREAVVTYILVPSFADAGLRLETPESTVKSRYQVATQLMAKWLNG